MQDRGTAAHRRTPDRDRMGRRARRIDLRHGAPGRAAPTGAPAHAVGDGLGKGPPQAFPTAAWAVFLMRSTMA
jgi:hypothetical protein